MSTGTGIITGFRAPLAALALGLATGANASPASDIAALRALQAADSRVMRVAFVLQTRGAELCPVRGGASGVSLHHVLEYGPAYRARASALWRLGDDVAVMDVAPGSPAEIAGLQPGDKVVKVDGRPLDAGLAGVRALGLRLAAPNLAPLSLEIRRERRTLDLTLRPAPACRSRVQVAPAKRARAWSDGELATVTAPLIAFTRSDDELAFVLAHEIAHNGLGHDGMRRASPAPGRKQREFAADRLAMRLMMAAGYDVRAVRPFLERLYRGPASAPLGRGGHLGLRERLRALFGGDPASPN